MSTEAKKRVVTAIIVLALLLILTIVILMLLGPLIGNVFTDIQGSLNNHNATSEASVRITPTYPPLPTATILDPVQEQLAQIDENLRQFLSASIVFNTPETMQLNETVTIELLLNPSLSEEEMELLMTTPSSGKESEGQVTVTGPVVTETIEITPRMKAKLLAQDPDAFIIQAIHSDAEQVISGTETTEWSWLVTAKTGGSQTLTLIIYRLVKFEGQEYWREVETYRADINVDITFGQRLKSLDWKWIVGILVTALLIPFFWRWYDRRKKTP